MSFTTEHRKLPARGFTIVELMISLVLGLIVIGGSLALFASHRATSGMSGQMADVQSEGRIALDALARDMRAAGDFGCWPVSNPPINKLSTDVLPVANGGLLGYDSGTSVGNGSAYGEAAVKTNLPDSASSVVAAYGVSGSLSNVAAGHAMVSQTDDLVVKLPVQPFQANDIAVITNCINWSKFSVSSVITDTAAKTQTLSHAAGTASGNSAGGNSDGALGELYGVGSTVGRLDAVWWYIGTQTNGDKGLYRLSARDGSPQLVSGRINKMVITYGLDTDANSVVDTTVNAAGVTDWNKVMVANIQMCIRSANIVTAVAQSTATCAGAAAPTDKHLYLSLQETISLRNQNP
jgi:type IV pilus assembly protein PilW